MFQALAREDEFIKLQLEANKSYVRRAKEIMDYYGLESERGFAFAYDVAVQSYSTYLSEKDKNAILSLKNEEEKLKLFARAMSAGADSYSRKNTIATGYGTVHGISYNINDWDISYTRKIDWTGF